MRILVSFVSLMCGYAGFVYLLSVMDELGISSPRAPLTAAIVVLSAAMLASMMMARAKSVPFVHTLLAAIGAAVGITFAAFVMMGQIDADLLHQPTWLVLIPQINIPINQGISMFATMMLGAGLIYLIQFAGESKRRLLSFRRSHPGRGGYGRV